jgi:hypothetical protein
MSSDCHDNPLHLLLSYLADLEQAKVLLRDLVRATDNGGATGTSNITTITTTTTTTTTSHHLLVSDLADLEQPGTQAEVLLRDLVRAADNRGATGTSNTVVVRLAQAPKRRDVGLHQVVLCQICGMWEGEGEGEAGDRDRWAGERKEKGEGEGEGGRERESQQPANNTQHNKTH